MNYFELFDIPVQLKVDKAVLYPKFIALSRQYHPDYFVNDGQQKLAESLEVSATLNKAWKTFQDPDATIKYVLQSKGLLEEEEKYVLPADFLMEVLELNESIMELDDRWPMMDGGPSKIPAHRVETDTDQSEIIGKQSAISHLSSIINNLQTETYEGVKEIVENYKEGVTSEEELLRVKEYYYKKKYLDRMRRELVGKL
jgi:molecular chaperone HscB